jgi:hypothetical protein
MLTRKKLIEANLKYARGAATKYSLRAPRSSAQWQDAFSAASEALCPGCGEVRPLARRLLLHVRLAVSEARGPRPAREREEALHAETTARHSFRDDCGTAAPSDARDQSAERDEFEAALVPSPEDQMLAAEARAQALRRLARVSFVERRTIEAVLDGKSTGKGRLPALRLAESGGVRVPASLLKNRQRLSGAARNARWYSRLSPEKKAERNEAKNERRRQARAAARAA